MPLGCCFMPMISPMMSGMAASCSQPWATVSMHLGGQLQAVHHRRGQAGREGALDVPGVVDLQRLDIGAQQGRQAAQR